MRYVSRPVEVEVMQWWVPEHDGVRLYQGAHEIVAWVNANGGEARYEPGHDGDQREFYRNGSTTVVLPRIAVRTVNGWAYAAPGHYVEMGDATWNAAEVSGGWRRVRDFYPCDPETFEHRWSPVAAASSAVEPKPQATCEHGWPKRHQVTCVGHPGQPHMPDRWCPGPAASDEAQQ